MDSHIQRQSGFSLSLEGDTFPLLTGITSVIFLHESTPQCPRQFKFYLYVSSTQIWYYKILTVRHGNEKQQTINRLQLFHNDIIIASIENCECDQTGQTTTILVQKQPE